MAILQFLHFFLDMHINYEEFIFFQNSMLKGKWGWAPSRGFPFSMGNMIRPLHSKLSMVDMSSALSSKSNTFAFSSIREGVTDLGITTVIRKIKKKYIDVYLQGEELWTGGLWSVSAKKWRVWQFTAVFKSLNYFLAGNSQQKEGCGKFS